MTVKNSEYKTEVRIPAYNYYNVQQKLQCIWANNTCYS
ncbi:hypothetical protein NO881_004190 [Salmonella enterica]|nr:hypothetical protein [Salmonella enterica]